MFSVISCCSSLLLAGGWDHCAPPPVSCQAHNSNIPSIYSLLTIFYVLIYSMHKYKTIPFFKKKKKKEEKSISCEVVLPHKMLPPFKTFFTKKQYRQHHPCSSLIHAFLCFFFLYICWQQYYYYYLFIQLKYLLLQKKMDKDPSFKWTPGYIRGYTVELDIFDRGDVCRVLTGDESCPICVYHLITRLNHLKSWSVKKTL